MWVDFDGLRHTCIGNGARTTHGHARGSLALKRNAVAVEAAGRTPRDDSVAMAETGELVFAKRVEAPSLLRQAAASARHAPRAWKTKMQAPDRTASPNSSSSNQMIIIVLCSSAPTR